MVPALILENTLKSSIQLSWPSFILWVSFVRLRGIFVLVATPTLGKKSLYGSGVTLK